MSVARDRERQMLVEALQRHYADELGRMSPHWQLPGEGPQAPPRDAAEIVGVPGAVLGAILAGKCRDQRIPVNPERQKRFAEWMCMHCASLWFTLNDSGVGAECAKGIVLTLALNDRFTVLNLACNVLGDVGAAAVSQAIYESRSLVHVDLAANDIGHHGANAVFEALRHNQSITSIDLSSRPGSLRNHLAKHNTQPLERLLAENQILAKLSLAGTGMGAEAAAGVARGLMANTTLVCLDLCGADLGPKGALAIAEALPHSSLEELNLADNRVGDEGLVALAKCLGAPPGESASGAAGGASPLASTAGAIGGTATAAVGTDTGEASAKYHEFLSLARRSILELNPAMLANRGESARSDALSRVRDNISNLAATVERTAKLPRLRILSVANSGGTVLGISRIEDALQANRCLEKLVLDQNDHRVSGTTSLMGSLPINSTLRHLSLANCRLGTAGILSLAKGLILNQHLEFLSLRGNDCGTAAAAALGGVLGGSRGTALRTLNLSSCHLTDEAGVAIATSLADNTVLETLHLRDNGLREESGRALVDMLRKHTVLTTLSLELNSIDFRFLRQVAQTLERNARIREKAKPEGYRRRIGELESCQREVLVLEETLRRNDVRKREAEIRQEAVLRELSGTREEEGARTKAMEERLEALRSERSEVDGVVIDLEMQLRNTTHAGEFEVGQLQVRIESLGERIRQHERHIAHTQGKIDAFEAKAGRELATAQEELEKVEKAHASASSLAAAARRNLDSFVTSMKSMEDGIPGAADPRRRRVQAKRGQESPGKKRAGSGGRSGHAKAKAAPPRPAAEDPAGEAAPPAAGPPPASPPRQRRRSVSGGGASRKRSTSKKAAQQEAAALGVFGPGAESCAGSP